MDDLKLLRDLGAELEHGPPPTLVRQRTRYLHSHLPPVDRLVDGLAWSRSRRSAPSRCPRCSSRTADRRDRRPGARRWT